MRAWVSSIPLFWRVFATNAAVLGLAFAVLVLGPVSVSAPVAAGEVVVLAAGLVVLLAPNLLLFRPAFRPLGELAEPMRRHDPLTPGERAQLVGGPHIIAIARAF